MANLSKAFVARLAGLHVIGPDGDVIGRVRDITVTVHSSGAAPRVTGLAVDLPTRRRIFIPMLRVAAIEPSAVSLVSGTINMHRFAERPGEELVVGSLIDSLVTVSPDDAAPAAAPKARGGGKARGGQSTRGGDTDRFKIVDVEIERQRSRDWIVSRVALRPKRSRMSRPGPVSVHAWSELSKLGAAPGETHGADSLIEHFATMRAADVAHELRELPLSRRLDVARHLDDQRLADILEELPHDEQNEIVSELDPERGADVLEAMGPDDAADLLSELPESEAEEFLALMDPEDSAPVRRLMSFDSNTAGGIMTPEPIALDPRTTVAEALAHCRNPDLSPALASLVFVVRPPTATPTGHYLGCVHIQALLRELPSTQVAELVDTSLQALGPDDCIDCITRFFATYNLVCGPVLDSDEHLIGAVTVDDLLDHMLPDDWRDTDKHDECPSAAHHVGAGR